MLQTNQQWANVEEIMGDQFDNDLDLSEVGYDVLEPRIRELVRSINALGVPTASSAEGHKNVDEGTDPFPWVAMRLLDDGKAGVGLIRLARLVAEWKHATKADWWFHPRLIVPAEGRPEAALYLRPSTDNDERDSQILERLQREAEGLAQYIASREAGC